MSDRSSRERGFALAVGRAIAIAAAVMAAGCGSPDVDVARRGHELRPTDSFDPWSYGSAEVASFASPGGFARVWYTLDGSHAPPTSDQDGDGVPDYVARVAAIADELGDRLDDEGWRSLVAESSVLGDPAAYGGDDRYDVYLRDFDAGDGHYRPDGCRADEDGSGVQVCAGHMILENDFAGLGYPSADYAARLVLTHEFFHGVQAAYLDEYPGWWSEGSATWFEEHVDPSQDDFEWLANIYFDSPERSLDDRQRGPSDSFAYGASLFVYYVEQTIGVEGIQGIMARAGRDQARVIDAVRAQFEAQGQPFGDAFQRFAVYNAFTGARAVDGQGYPDAGRFAMVAPAELSGDRAFDWRVAVDGLAAKYAWLSFDRPIALSLAPIEGYAGELRLAVVDPRAFGESGEIAAIEGDATLELDPSQSPVMLVVSNATDAEGAFTLKVRGVSGSGAVDGGTDGANNGGVDTDEPGVDQGGGVEPGDEAGGDGGGCASAPGDRPSTSLLVLFLLIPGLLASRRRQGGRDRESEGEGG